MATGIRGPSSTPTNPQPPLSHQEDEAMPSVAGSGTQTATIGTEHQLFNSSAAGTYIGFIDMVNMAAGDVVELRVYRMVLTGGTTRVAYKQIFQGAQVADDVIKVAEPVVVAITDSGAYRLTLKQTLGTGRAFPWSVETP
jgi:hypothetical protein